MTHDIQERLFQPRFNYYFQTGIAHENQKTCIHAHAVFIPGPYLHGNFSVHITPWKDSTLGGMEVWRTDQGTV